MQNIATHIIESHVSGPKLIIIGGIHGNEPAGPLAIREIIKEFFLIMWPDVANG